MVIERVQQSLIEKVLLTCFFVFRPESMDKGAAARSLKCAVTYF